MMEQPGSDPYGITDGSKAIDLDIFKEHWTNTDAHNTRSCADTPNDRSLGRGPGLIAEPPTPNGAPHEVEILEQGARRIGEPRIKDPSRRVKELTPGFIFISLHHVCTFKAAILWGCHTG
jgi:hypothetical protein